MNEINKEAILLSKEIKRLEKRSNKAFQILCEKSAELQQICIHNETEIKLSYQEGGYYERCKYVNTTVCKICGKEIKREETLGGFN
jgi:hypothetical protein